MSTRLIYLACMHCTLVNNGGWSVTRRSTFIYFNLQVIMIKEVPGPAISDTAVYTGQWLYIYMGKPH